MNEYLESVPRRSSVYGNVAVTTSQPLASEAGISVLREGGSAVDASICMAAVLTVVEPCSNGIGGDLFSIVHDNSLIHGINSSGPSGSNTKRENFLGFTQMPRNGWETVTVPGCVAGWVELHQKFGKVDFIRLLEPAIEFARKGFPVGPETARAWKKSMDRFKKEKDWMKTFAPNGKSPNVGERIFLKDHATTLEEIAQTNGESFYRGSLAEKILIANDLGGGGLTREDLISFQPEEVSTLKVNFNGYEIHELPPNTQGIAALIALSLLERLNISCVKKDNSLHLHLIIEAIKIGMSLAYKHVCDLQYLEYPIERLIDPDWIDKQVSRIKFDKAQDFGHYPEPYSSTVYIASSDKSGQMVSLIQSNYEGFGSGVVIPGTGIAMQNRGSCFTLDKNHPNVVGPNKRPFHTIIPGFVTQNGLPIMAFGVMGGPMQAQGHVQLLYRLLVENQDPQEAMDSPRFRVEAGLNVFAEPAFSEKTLSELAAKGHKIKRVNKPSVTFGGGQLIKLMKDSVVVAASDGRREGMAICY